jgi:UPF0271 protein
VEQELKKTNLTSLRFTVAVESGKVKIKAPTQEFLTKAKASAAMMGDVHLLSDADMELLAVALELKASGYSPQIVTDDYSIQNVATQLGLGFVALATFGIRHVLKWVRYCPACRKEYPADQKSSECRVCGTALKRRPLRTEKRTPRSP